MPRRSRFDQERDNLIAAMRAGATEAYACAGLRPPIARRTLGNWKTENPEFAAQLTEAKQIPDGHVQVALFRAASGRAIAKRRPVLNRSTGEAVLGPTGDVLYDEEFFQPNVIAMIWWLKNRQPEDWKDRHEVSGGDRPVLVEIVERAADDQPTFRGE